MIKKYIIITAARNEEKFIDASIQSVTKQCILPLEWLIVSDNSIDDTDKIVAKYSKNYKYIKLVRIDNGKTRNFSSKAFAINYGYRKIKEKEYEFLSILDADIELPENYYKNILEKFNRNIKLGISGGTVYDKSKNGYKKRIGNSERSVPGGIQVFRRKCYEEIGNFSYLKYGGEDWVAELKGRQKGWEVKSYPNIHVLHNRPTGTALGNSIKSSINAGITAYYIGSLPVFEILKSIRRIHEWPYLFCTMSRIYGYTKKYFHNKCQLNNEEYSVLLRMEQKERLRNLFKNPSYLLRRVK